MAPCGAPALSTTGRASRPLPSMRASAMSRCSSLPIGGPSAAPPRDSQSRTRRTLSRRRLAASPPTRARTKSLAGFASSSSGVAFCTTLPSLEDDDALAEAHRLVDVVGDHQDGLAGGRVDADHLGLQRVAGDRVERAEGLVHEQDVGIGGKRAGEADALLLAAGELMRAAVAEGRRIELDQGHQFVDALVDALLRPAEQARHGGDVVADAPVRKQADRLDDVAETAAQRDRIERGDVVVVDADRTGVRARSAG